MPVEFQVIMIYVATKKLLLDVDVDKVTRFEKEFFEYIKTSYPDIPKAIREEKEISEETDAKLQKAIAAFKEEFR